MGELGLAGKYRSLCLGSVWSLLGLFYGPQIWKVVETGQPQYHHSDPPQLTYSPWCPLGYFLTRFRISSIALKTELSESLLVSYQGGEGSLQHAVVFDVWVEAISAEVATALGQSLLIRYGIQANIRRVTIHGIGQVAVLVVFLGFRNLKVIVELSHLVTSHSVPRHGHIAQIVCVCPIRITS